MVGRSVDVRSKLRGSEEGLELALRREVADVRSGDHGPEAVRELIRDMIANCFGIYHVEGLDADIS